MIHTTHEHGKQRTHLYSTHEHSHTVVFHSCSEVTPFDARNFCAFSENAFSILFQCIIIYITHYHKIYEKHIQTIAMCLV